MDLISQMLMAGASLNIPGLSWSNVTNTSVRNILDMIWDGSRFVAITTNATVITSTDGITWTTLITNLGNDNLLLSSIAWSGSRYVITTSSVSRIFTSTDGINWTTITISPNNTLDRVRWLNNLFIATGSNGIIWTSSDGVTWNSRSSGTTENLDGDISSNGSIFVIVGRFTILTSPDGITWTSRATALISSRTLPDVIWTGSLFITIASNEVLTSPDGITWTVRTLPSGFFSGDRLATSGSLTIATNISGDFITSTDGITWQHSSRFSGNTRKRAVLWLNGSFYAAGTDVSISTDGVNWNIITGEHLTSVIWTGTQYLVTASNGFVFVGSDLQNLTRRKTSTDRLLTSVAWNGSIFVAVGIFTTGQTNCTILTSPDGITWTNRTTPTPVVDLNNIIWEQNLFVAVGNQGTVLTSPDGITWTRRSIGFSSPNMVSVIWTGTQFVASSTDQFISVSTNGLTWTTTQPSTLIGFGMRSIIWTGAQFIIVGDDANRIFYSSDLVTWTSNSILQQLQSIAKSPDLIIAVGATESIGLTPWSSLAGTSSIFTTQDNGTTWVARTIPPDLAPLSSVIWTGTQFVAVGSYGRISIS